MVDGICIFSASVHDLFFFILFLSLKVNSIFCLSSLLRSNLFGKKEAILMLLQTQIISLQSHRLIVNY